MKLAEALIIRTDTQNKISQIANRLRSNATVQEGEKPTESPIELIKAYKETLKQLESLVVKINLTNSKTAKDGVTITEKLAKRDMLKLQISDFRNFLFDASNLSKRARATEIKLLSTVDVSSFQKEIDNMSAELRKLDIEIQELNWTTELID